MSRVKVKKELRSTRLRRSAGPAVRPDALADFDTQLMLQVREGAADASNMLLRRNFARVARYISRVVRDPRAVEDLSQEVFLQVLANADRYEPAAKFSTWLYRIATNTALNHLNQAYIRRRAKEPGGVTIDVPDNRPETGPDRRMDLHELKNRVSQAVGELPIRQRIALTLSEYEELSYQQIAAVMEVTVEAVRCLLARARATLRRKLAGLA